MSKHKKVGFVGAGNMATALIKGMLESLLYQKEQLFASDSSRDALDKVARDFGLVTFYSNRDLLSAADVIILSVKPQVIGEVLTEMREGFRPEHLIISIAAGIPLELIRNEIGRDLPLIRVMPNTPALVQKGVSALAAGPRVGQEDLTLAREIFGAVGETVEVDESMMDAVTALSGSGPGYLFRIMESLISAGIAVGLEKEVSHLLVTQTFLGAAYLAKESGEPPSILREMVTSPGGTTEAGLEILDRSGLESILRNAVDAAYRRSIELGKRR